MKMLGALMLALVVACSSGPSTGRSPARTNPEATPAKDQTRIAVLEGGSSGGKSVLIIADVSGHTLAQATFDSMPRPLIANAGDILPTSVRVAAGAAYYAEPTGKIHRLDPTGTDTIVATFALSTAQQELSFAVSPNGKQLIAIVVTAPAVHDPPPKDLSQPFFKEGARWSTELERATAGGATESVLKTDLGPADRPFGSVTTIAGWDDAGPVALLDTVLAAQQPPASTRLPGGTLVHLGADGTHLDQIGGPNCHPLDELRNGTILCYSGAWPRSYEVRTASGQVMWQQDLFGGFYYDPVLSPDGRRVAVQNTLFMQGLKAASVARQSTPQLPTQAQGWVTADTLAVHANSSGSVQLVDVVDLQHPRETGLRGMFVGTL